MGRFLVPLLLACAQGCGSSFRGEDSDSGGVSGLGGTDAGTGGATGGSAATGGAVSNADAGQNGGATSGGGAAIGGGPSIGGGGPADAAPPPDGPTGECHTRQDCEACCDELLPDGRGPFASALSGCGCDVQCVDDCFESLCTTIYDWSEACIGCLREDEDGACLDERMACEQSAECGPYAACIYSCTE